MPQLAAAQAFDAFNALPDPIAILAADGAMVRANPAFRATFRQWIGPGRPPWGRVQPPDFIDGERRFVAPAPDGRRFEWAERLLPDGARLISARDITRHVSAAEDALRAKTRQQQQNGTGASPGRCRPSRHHSRRRDGPR